MKVDRTVRGWLGPPQLKQFAFGVEEKTAASCFSSYDAASFYAEYLPLLCNNHRIIRIAHDYNSIAEARSGPKPQSQGSEIREHQRISSGGLG